MYNGSGEDASRSFFGRVNGQECDRGRFAAIRASVISKIATDDVIERPAGVVKELLQEPDALALQGGKR